MGATLGLFKQRSSFPLHKKVSLSGKMR